MTIVAVVDRSHGERVLIEAARLAADRETDLHVVYVLPLKRYGALELDLAERLGLPVRLDFFEDMCKQIANSIASPLADDYVPVGLVGKPDTEILNYATEVDADLIVVPDRSLGDTSSWSVFGSPMKQLHKSDIPVIPV